MIRPSNDSAENPQFLHRIESQPLARLRRIELRIIRSYVRLCPLAWQVNLVSPGIPGLALLAYLPR